VSARKRPSSKRLAAVDPGPNPCLNCPNPSKTLSTRRRIAVGFGEAHLERDGKVIWREEYNQSYESCMSVLQAENLAKKEPRHDWRIVLHGPLHGETYQRQGPKNWVCVETNRGFA
jgi:hypothetical protein